MENKYYTPTIEEFHVGFEYYLKDINGNPLESKQVLKSNLMILDIKQTLVKYLDQSDIESLGWKEDSRFLGTKAVMLNNDRYKIIRKDIIWDLYKNGEYYGICCNTTNPTHIFYGTIKNKSEFKKLMQQLNIK